MAHFNSGDVKVYPSAKRSVPFSRLMSEQGITGAIKHLTPDNSGTFLITLQIDLDSNSADTVDFCILGYYFSVDKEALTFSANDSWYVWINSLDVIASGDYAGFEEIIGTDASEGADSGKYTGLNYSTSEPTGWSTIMNEHRGMQIIMNGKLCESSWSLYALFSKYTPAVIADTNKTENNKKVPATKDILHSQLWVDTTLGGIAKYWDETAQEWIGIGAVYKQQQNS